mmetsp:Transcript_94840/g.306184  ORF Transcript_94840/g.306184 Transcript_94840/m.306184 type:complete len:213 (+) Transcript_94840:202-840(+)
MAKASKSSWLAARVRGVRSSPAITWNNTMCGIPRQLSGRRSSSQPTSEKLQKTTSLLVLCEYTSMRPSAFNTNSLIRHSANSKLLGMLFASALLLSFQKKPQKIVFESFSARPNRTASAKPCSQRLASLGSSASSSSQQWLRGFLTLQALGSSFGSSASCRTFSASSARSTTSVPRLLRKWLWPPAMCRRPEVYSSQSRCCGLEHLPAERSR